MEGLERGPEQSSRVRVPGGVVLYCWGGSAALTASSEMADGSPATRINHSCNGCGAQPTAAVSKDGTNADNGEVGVHKHDPQPDSHLIANDGVITENGLEWTFNQCQERYGIEPEVRFREQDLEPKAPTRSRSPATNSGFGGFSVDRNRQSIR